MAATQRSCSASASPADSMRLASLALATAMVAVQISGRADGAAVRIDAVLADARGRSVEDLKPEDFQLLEDGAPRAIDSVRLIKSNAVAPPFEAAVPVSSRADEQDEAARENVRLFAVFIDEYHLTAGDGVSRARQRLTEFVDERLGPRDLL